MFMQFLIITGLEVVTTRKSPEAMFQVFRVMKMQVVVFCIHPRWRWRRQGPPKAWYPIV